MKDQQNERSNQTTDSKTGQKQTPENQKKHGVLVTEPVSKDTHNVLAKDRQPENNSAQNKKVTDTPDTSRNEKRSVEPTGDSAPLQKDSKTDKQKSK